MIKVKLLWYDQRDGHGIVQDIQGNEYYIDSSVLKFDHKLLSTHDGAGVSRTGLVLTIEINKQIRNCLCGKNIQLDVKTSEGN